MTDESASLDQIFAELLRDGAVTIGGGTVSGKTTLATILATRAAAEHHRHVVMVSHDAFMYAREIRSGLYEKLARGEIDEAAYNERTWNLRAIDRCIRRIDGARAGILRRSLLIPAREHRSDATVTASLVELTTSSLVIVEGAGALHTDRYHLRGQMVWCTTPPVGTVVLRKMRRAEIEGVHVSPSSVRHRYLTAERVHETWLSENRVPCVTFDAAGEEWQPT